MTITSKSFVTMTAQYGGGSVSRLDYSSWLGRPRLHKSVKLLERWDVGSRSMTTVTAPLGQTSVVKYYYWGGLDSSPVIREYYLATRAKWVEITADAVSLFLDSIILDKREKIEKDLIKYYVEKEPIWHQCDAHRILQMDTQNMRVFVKNLERDEPSQWLTYQQIVGW